MTEFRGWLTGQGGGAAPGHGGPVFELAPAADAQNYIGATQDGLSVGCAGDPLWLDAALADLAAARGHGAALLTAYRTYGRRCLERLGGSFAVAFIDAQRRTCLLAIDRLGIGRLCFASVRGMLAFGTTVTAVAAHPSIGFTCDPQAVYDYLYYHCVPAPRTIAAGVSKLGPGEFCEWTDGRVETGRYWHCRFDSGTRFDFDAAAHELRDALEHATREQRAENCGSFLSGGIDSSTVAGMLSLTGTAPRTFTIGFAAEGYDEVGYARIAAQRFGAIATERYITPRDVADTMHVIAGAFDEPFGNSSAVPVYLCAATARERGVTLLLAGDGGDELFGGNARYARQKIFERYALVPQWCRERLLEPLASGSLAKVAPVRKLRSYIDQAVIPLPDRLQTYNYFARETPESILHADLLERIDLDGPAHLQRRVFAEPATGDIVNRMLYLDWKLTLADNDLRKVTTCSRAAGVEVRYPWLHQRVLELSLRVPGTYKVRGTKLRYFVKRALDGFLPREIIHKSKHGFGLPFGVWMRDDAGLQALVADAMHTLSERRLVRKDYVERLLHQHRVVHAAYYGEFLWVLTMLELWLRQHGARYATT